ncbi:MAG: type I-C CRISPR-associated protein Cas8c/Csd1 [Anaerolineaceae bacterium]|jgi:CRISPR-associated protein Csd1
MTWVKDLYDTYEKNQNQVYQITEDDSVPLLYLGHTTQKAHIEIVIDLDGNFRRAYLVPKEESRTIIPCTENSGGRAAAFLPHPLADKLQYIAGDYKKYGGPKKSIWKEYVEQLNQWCASDYSHPLALAVLRYTNKGTVITDLINYRVIPINQEHKMFTKKKDSQGDAAQIFKMLSDPSEAFVRWIVEDETNPPIKTWQDHTLWESWLNFLMHSKTKEEFCYVLGKQAIMPDTHPFKIRSDGDKAKLISSNDLTAFTFRGRFLEKDQAASVSFEVTQKAHSALRWLISRQGFTRDELAIVAWAIDGSEIPPVIADTPTFLLQTKTDYAPMADTDQGFGIALAKSIAGYNAKLEPASDVVVMAFDSATEGRMAITYYRKLIGSELIEKLADWHNSCAWTHNYLKKNIKDPKTGLIKPIYITFQGAPAPSDIAEAAYGPKVNDKNDRLSKHTISRLIPCIVEGQPIPRDLMLSAVRRASMRAGKKSDKEKREWNKTLSIACSLFRKYNRKENYKMTLDTQRKTRDYLYGRLLAVAENIEEWALSISGDKSETNAARLMQRFADHPFTTWRTIELALNPYIKRLRDKSISRQRLIDEIMNSFQHNDFLNDKPLSGEFLLGYHNQREHFFSRPSSASLEG